MLSNADFDTIGDEFINKIEEAQEEELIQLRKIQQQRYVLLDALKSEQVEVMTALKAQCLFDFKTKLQAWFSQKYPAYFPIEALQADHETAKQSPNPIALVSSTNAGSEDSDFTDSDDEKVAIQSTLGKTSLLAISATNPTSEQDLTKLIDAFRAYEKKKGVLSLTTIRSYSNSLRFFTRSFGRDPKQWLAKSSELSQAAKLRSDHNNTKSAWKIFREFLIAQGLTSV